MSSMIDSLTLPCLTAGSRDLLVHVAAEGHFEIEAAVGRGDAVVGGGPVGHHDAVEAPLLLGDFDVEVVVLRWRACR